MLKLNCKSQNYAWGRLGNESIVCKIHQAHAAEEAKYDETPFAEYWMGDHVNGPSSFMVTQEACQWMGEDNFVGQKMGTELKIGDLCQSNPDKFLGPGYQERYPHAKTNLAFLFKVLSVRTALSIQAHPNRAKAEQLHVQRPDVYKDPNPKPELAIALSDDFEACFGFADEQTLVKNFAENKALAE